ncbi:Crp/Fnr family transcriptional regulator [Caldimonas sp. KR1-144]|uniref:Crp/Fnr family transcriptional regulator n=1 Tax=Caldimonas sp. KR1-144 TaxID=3400911 RepID=UPI003C1109D6
MLRRSSWVASLTPDQLQRVEQESSERVVGAGAYLARRGEAVEHWYGVVEGIVKVYTVSSEGRTMSYAAITAGGWFGEGSMLWPSRQRMYDATALRESHILCISRATFDWLSASSAAFNRFLAEHLASRLGQLMSALEHDRLTPPESRLAHCLLEVFNPTLNPGSGTRIAITQEEIGYLCGLSRQVVNRALREFEEAGLIKLEYGVLSVLSMEGLQAASHDASARG